MSSLRMFTTPIGNKKVIDVVFQKRRYQFVLQDGEISPSNVKTVKDRRKRSEIEEVLKTLVYFRTNSALRARIGPKINQMVNDMNDIFVKLMMENKQSNQS